LTSSFAAESETEAEHGSPYSAIVEAELTLARFEAMTPAEIDAELTAAGIDPRATIDAVTRLVDAALQRSRHR